MRRSIGRLRWAAHAKRMGMIRNIHTKFESENLKRGTTLEA
jgi:hypothetical protein